MQCGFNSKDYGVYELVSIYELLVKDDTITFQDRFPELMNYRDNLKRIFEIAEKHQLSKNEFAAFEIAHSAFSYIELTNNKEFLITDDMERLLGEPKEHDFFEYLLRYSALAYPEALIDEQVLQYSLFFSKIFKDIYVKKIKKEDYVNSPQLYRLIELVTKVRRRCPFLYKTREHRFGFIIEFIASYCYYQDIGYDLVYNFLSHPRYYTKKMLLSEYISNDGPIDYIWYSGGRERAFRMVPEVFVKVKK